MSSPAKIFKKTSNRFRWPSLSPTGEMGTNSDTTRDDGQKRDNANPKHNGAELALPTVLDLGLVTQPIHGLSTELKQWATSSHSGSSNPPFQDSGRSPAAVNPSNPAIIFTSRASVPQRMPSLANSGGGSNISLPLPLQSSDDVCTTPIKDRYQIFGRNFIFRRPSKTLIQLALLALQDRVLVCWELSTHSNFVA
jgi:hypothetical protein